MPAIDSVGSQALYLAATQAGAQQAAKNAQSQQKNEKTGKAARPSFLQSLTKSQEEAELVQNGLPLEIAGMDKDDALVFLKDAVEIAGDELKAKQDLVSMEAYRKSVKQFMQFVVKYSFDLEKNEARKIDRRTGQRKVIERVQIKIIDEKLNHLASEMMVMQKANLNLLARVDEINGLIVDLMAG